MQTETYTRVKWADHVRQFYAEWLTFTGYRADNARAFDRFVALCEERMGDWLMDPCLDFSGLGLTREDDE